MSERKMVQADMPLGPAGSGRNKVPEKREVAGVLRKGPAEKARVGPTKESFPEPRR